MYDLIGDIHGCADELVRLLETMGYKSKKGIYQHESRCAIFVGDMINRGEKSREVLHLIRPMIQNGYAQAILGNHELNLMAFFTLDDNNKPLYTHSIRNILQLSPVFESFRNSEAELHDYIDWMYTLPLFLEFEDFRVVHACWHQESINFVRKNMPQKRMTRENLIKAYQTRGPEAKAINILIKGLEIALPRNKKSIDADSRRRGFVRVRWWDEHKGKTYKQISTQSKIKVPNYKIPANLINVDVTYPDDAPPVFIGHYSLNGRPALLKKNVCCLDFSVVKTRTITAYRWHGETKLLKSHLITS